MCVCVCVGGGGCVCVFVGGGVVRARAGVSKIEKKMVLNSMKHSTNNDEEEDSDAEPIAAISQQGHRPLKHTLAIYGHRRAKWRVY